MGQRADKKKFRRIFKVGEKVTWGIGFSSHVILEVCQHGLIVDSAAEGWPRVFVSFTSSRPRRRPPGVSLTEAGPPRYP